MPKSPQRNEKVQEDEARVMEYLKDQPEMLDELQQIFVGTRKKQLAKCKAAAEQLNVTGNCVLAFFCGWCQRGY